jgi:DNA polymerase-3 subunit epsilon
VLDLETTGLGAEASITEAAAVVVTRGRATRELFVEVGRAERQHAAVARLLRFAGDAVLCGHNLRFDIGFLDRQLRARGLRIAAPTVDTLPLARRLLAGRTRAFSLAALAEFFGCASRPSHQALPDARATAEVLVRLLELAAEAGATTVGDVAALARPRAPR